MKPCRSIWLAPACAATLALGCGQAGGGAAKPTAQAPQRQGAEARPPAPDFEATVRPALVRHCTPCHEGAEAKDGIDVTKVARSDTAQLMRIVSEIESGEMPPKSAAPLDPETKAKLLEGLKANSL